MLENFSSVRFEFTIPYDTCKLAFLNDQEIIGFGTQQYIGQTQSLVFDPIQTPWMDQVYWERFQFTQVVYCHLFLGRAKGQISSTFCSFGDV